MRFVITADESCMHNYNLSFMAGFLSCVPRDQLPRPVIKYIEGKFFSAVPNREGVAEIAILALRKIESCLRSHGHEVIVAVPQAAEKFDADVYLVSAMDPFGIGPATTTMVGLTGGDVPFNKFFFQSLVGKIRAAHPNAKIIAGGPGAWEFEIFPDEASRLGIDCVFNGAMESAPREFWTEQSMNSLPKSYRPPPASIRPDPFPIIAPSFWGMVEISRGCGRGCQFCDFELMSGFKWLPKEFILKESAINAASPLVETITLLSEDTLRYGTPQGSWKPTGDIVGLVRELAKFGKPLSFTHCCLATALANPKVTEEFSHYAGLDEKHLAGFQTGIESGSPRMVERYMKGKLLPWKAEDWPEVVEQGMAVMIDNYIVPHATMVMGLAEETPDDTIKSIELVERLKDYPSLIMPLFFVPLSILKDRPFIAGMMTQEHKELMAVSMRHTARWARKLPNWSGSLKWNDRLVFTAGAEYSFEFMESMSQGSLGKKSAAMLIARAGIKGAMALLSNPEPEVEYFKSRRLHYPILKKTGFYEDEVKEPFAVFRAPDHETGCGSGTGQEIGFIPLSALEGKDEE